MYSKKPLIVVIDDLVTREQPLIGYLELYYDVENIHLFQSADEGIEFIEANLSKKIIVLLDIMFNNREVGFDIFKEISKKSALVCFIVMTGNIELVSWQGLQSLINGHAWYIIQRDKKAKEILEVVRSAEEHINLRVDGALEEWIYRHSAEELNKPFLKVRGGESLTLLDILDSLRTGSQNGVGQKIAASMLALAVELWATDKSNIGDK